MLGMFAVIIQDDQVSNTARIVQEVKAGEKYMVQFLGDPSFARVCQIEEIQSWLLFKDQKQADNWLQKSVMQQPTPPDEIPNGTTPPDPAPPGGPQPSSGPHGPEAAQTPAHKLPPIEEQIPTLDPVPPSDVPGDPDAQTN